MSYVGLKIAEKIYFFLHLFHVIVLRKAGEKAEGGAGVAKVKVRSSVNRFAVA